MLLGVLELWLLFIILVCRSLLDLMKELLMRDIDCGMMHADEEGFQGRIEKKHPALAHDHGAWGAINE